MTADAKRLDRRLLLFTGKGGVGKSTVVAGVALALAKRGKRPLIVELGHRASMTSIFRGREIGYDPRSVGHGVHAMNVDFERALADYMAEHVPIPRLARTILANDALSRFFHAAPAVAEIAVLNKLAALERERDGGRPRWDPILVDLDATGHALMLLNLPRVMDGLVGDGPMRRLVDGFTTLLSDAKRTSISLVTIPRELPAQETVELHDKLVKEHRVALSTLFVNMVPRSPFSDDVLDLLDGVEDRAEANGDDARLADLALARRSMLIAARAQGQIDRLREQVPLPLVQIPMRRALTSDLELLANTMATSLDGIEEVGHGSATTPGGTHDPGREGAR
jgi:anion-transporting  ArsA/GET3 family ATPase